MAEWASFLQQGLFADGKLFVPEEVRADGTCFFHSLVKSSLVNFADGHVARQHFVDTLYAWWQNPAMRELVVSIQQREKNAPNFETYLRRKAQTACWVNQDDLTLACLVFNVSIVSISNHCSGMQAYYADLFLSEAVKRNLRLKGTVFVYHHLWNCPCTPTVDGSHFCFLHQVDTNGMDIQVVQRTIANAYRGISPTQVPLQNLVDGNASRELNHESHGVVGNSRTLPSAVSRTSPTNRSRQTTLPFETACKGSLPKKATAPKSTKQVQKDKEKCAMQSLVSTWIKKPTVDEATLVKVHERMMDPQDMKDKVERAHMHEGMLNTVRRKLEMDKFSSAPGRVSTGRDDRAWSEKSVIIYVYLHPMLGKKDAEGVAAVFGVNINTFRGWMSKKASKVLWVDMVCRLLVKDVIASIPSIHRHMLAQDPLESYHELDMVAVKRDYQVVSTGTQLVLDKNAFRQSGKAIPKKKAQLKKSGQGVYVKVDAKRIHMSDEPAWKKHPEANEFVARIVAEAWNTGVGLTLVVVKKELLSFMAGNAAWNTSYGDKNTTNKFIARALDYAGFACRAKTVSQKIPENWYDLALKAAAP
jgi:hypothetical protein